MFVCTHIHISDCFPWKHNTINKRNIFPKGKAQEEQQQLVLTAEDTPPQITTGLERGSQESEDWPLQ